MESSRSLSSGAHSRDPLARNDGRNTVSNRQSLVKADDGVIARANATFRVVPKREA